MATLGIVMIAPKKQRRSPMNKLLQLKAKIARLEREKAQLRAFLHEIIEAHYRVINQEPEKPKKEASHE